MANEKNLKPQNTRSKSEQRKIAAMGGEASGEARRRKRTFRDVLTALLDSKFSAEKAEIIQGIILRENEGEPITADEAIAIAQIYKAVTGDTAAAAWVRDTVGEKPTDKIDASLDGSFKLVVEDVRQKEQ